MEPVGTSMLTWYLHPFGVFGSSQRDRALDSNGCRKYLRRISLSFQPMARMMVPPVIPISPGQDTMAQGGKVTCSSHMPGEYWAGPGLQH